MGSIFQRITSTLLHIIQFDALIPPSFCDWRSASFSTHSLFHLLFRFDARATMLETLSETRKFRIHMQTHVHTRTHTYTHVHTCVVALSDIRAIVTWRSDFSSKSSPTNSGILQLFTSLDGCFVHTICKRKCFAKENRVLTAVHSTIPLLSCKEDAKTRRNIRESDSHTYIHTYIHAHTHIHSSIRFFYSIVMSTLLIIKILTCSPFCTHTCTRIYTRENQDSSLQIE